jgi:hypothetical protein
MNGIQRWFTRYSIEITWFIIGWLSLDFIHEFGHGNWGGMLIDAVLIALNYYLAKR